MRVEVSQPSASAPPTFPRLPLLVVPLFLNIKNQQQGPLHISSFYQLMESIRSAMEKTPLVKILSSRLGRTRVIHYDQLSQHNM